MALSALSGNRQVVGIFVISFLLRELDKGRVGRLKIEPGRLKSGEGQNQTQREAQVWGRGAKLEGKRGEYQVTSYPP